MSIIRLTPAQFLNNRRKIIRFLRNHGDRRITLKAIRWIKGATKKDVEQEGFLALCALHHNIIIGVLVVADYGRVESLIAIHKKYRNQHIAKRMVQQAISTLGKMYSRVAMDNIPSLKICFDNGMVAFHLFTGVTNKPTLWLGGGSWKKEDVLEQVATISLS